MTLRPALSLALLLTLAANLPASPLDTPIHSSVLDPAAFADWVDGHETPVSPESLQNGARDVVWTSDNRTEWRGVRFGESKLPGPRHLRIGLREPVKIESVLVRSGGRLSVLKEDAAYPGDLAGDEHWLPAERIVNGTVGNTEVGEDEYSIWILPKGTRTRALRFTHEAAATDREPAGHLGGVWAFSERVVNLAPQATASASAHPEIVARTIDETNNRTWQTWDNGKTGAPVPVTARDAEWLLLAWPRAVTLDGVCMLWAGFAAAEIQAFTGSEAESPTAAPSSSWQRVAQAQDLDPWYPFQLGPNWIDFDRAVKTTALRVRITAPIQPRHPHLMDKVVDGRRVWLGELLALSRLDDKPLQTALIPRQEQTPPPIPVRFRLPEPGLVTLVIEDRDGRRVRNLVSETPFPAGDNVAWWDGSDDLGRDVDAARHGLYHVPTRFVEPGTYNVRGLWRKPLKLVYEFSVYNAGRPPWVTADGTGCWMTNHTPPTSMAFVPGSRTSDGKPLLFMGAFVSEGGHGIQWVREDGTKAGGQGRIGGTWTGAPTLAVDLGTRVASDHLCYAGSVWEGELRLTAKTRSLQDKEILKLKLGDDPRPQDLAEEERPGLLAGFDGGDRRFVLAGLAAHNGLLVGSLTRQNELLLFSASDGKRVGKIAVDNPRGVAFDHAGRLLVLSGNRLLRRDAVHLPETGPATDLNLDGLEDPRHVAQDAQGNFYVSNHGGLHQVKVFSPDGRFLHAVGKPGLPAMGPYDPMRMNHPNGLAIDSQNRLWVAENDFHPKRVSVWSADGKLVRAFYGPGEYGGGGVLDPRDKHRFYYKGLEFQLDWQAGTDRLVRVFYRPDDLLEAHYGHYSPDTPLYPDPAGDDNRYFTSCYTHNPTNGDRATFLWHDNPQGARLVAAIGSAHEWEILKSESFHPCWPADVEPLGDRWKNPAVFTWSDTNGDAAPQPGEVRMIKAESGGVTVNNDLSVVFARFDDRALLVTPAGFTECHAPIYNIDRAETIVDGVQGAASSGGDQALAHNNGWSIHTNAPKPYSNHGLGGAFQGIPRWTYPSLWPGLHASHEAAVPDRPGMVVGHTRLLGGWVEPEGEAGPMFCVNGNMGNMYLLTADGLFVGTLFHDIRLRPNWAMPTAQRGMDVSDVSLHDENFWPSITQTSDGQVYLVDGARTSLVRIDGLDTIHRLDAEPLTISTDDLAAARTWLEAAETARQAAALREPLRVDMREEAPTIDGRLDDWPATTRWAVIDRRGTKANFNSNSMPYDASGAVCVSGDRLMVAYRTTEKDLLKNSGELPQTLFKTGGCLDLMLATDPSADPDRRNPVAGDLRLLVTTVDGQTRAALYRAVVPGTKEPVKFSSPWRTITLDSVEDVSKHVVLAADGQGRFEFSIPLSVLGWNPQPGQAYRGDIGLLRGNGFQTLQRIYWANKATAITSDVPSEAELTPRLWGMWQL